MSERPYDLILFGATGFTGALTADYLAAHVPDGTRWALAGRSKGRLAAVRNRLGERWAELPLLPADVKDPASLRTLARAARVVITTVGPYVEYGDPVVAACADVGTDYVDLTGEPEFVDRTYLHHHARAVRSGARLVHCCGFDSIPHDLGVYFTVGQLPADVAINVRGFVRAEGSVSGGTLRSAVTAFSRVGATMSAGRERRRVEPVPPGRRVRSIRGVPGRDADARAWVVPLPTIDPQVIARSARALDRYGPDFSYGHFAAIVHLPLALGGMAGAAALLGAAQLPPLRRALLGRVPPGQGPSQQKRAASWFTVRFVGEGGGQKVITEVSGGDPGYTETAKMLAESALCLAFDELPPTCGQVTTATAMGDALIGRLVAAGLRFDVLAQPPTGPPSRKA